VALSELPRVSREKSKKRFPPRREISDYFKEICESRFSVVSLFAAKKNTHLFPRVNKKAQIRYYSIKRSATGERIVIVVVIFSVRAK